MTLSSKERATLRAEAHHLDPIVRIGHHGLSDTLLGALDDALRTHELVKVQIGRQTELSAREAAQQLAGAVRADVVQVIGKTVTLYRENPEIDRPKGALPPWRR
jgi:RNA-binding protein